MNLHAQKTSLPSASWIELWEELQESAGITTSSPLLPVSVCVCVLLCVCVCVCVCVLVGMLGCVG